ncbi:MAG: translesion error-prone DNA polymerase V autoproteolytic subunit [Hylemonella sp.]|nr:translesion error-prone DNA polymerase V autoproteolytic subunit [Hylemonella sp.]
MDFKVPAGFPSPAEEFASKRIDVLAKVIKHPTAAYQMVVRGESMRDAGIDDGDVAIIDRGIEPRSGQIVVAVLDGEYTIKHLWQRAGRIKLKAANPTYADIVPKDGQTIEIWGIVVATLKIHKT